MAALEALTTLARVSNLMISIGSFPAIWQAWRCVILNSFMIRPLLEVRCTRQVNESTSMQPDKQASRPASRPAGKRTRRRIIVNDERGSVMAVAGSRFHQFCSLLSHRFPSIDFNEVQRLGNRSLLTSLHACPTSSSSGGLLALSDAWWVGWLPATIDAHLVFLAA